MHNNLYYIYYTQFIYRLNILCSIYNNGCTLKITQQGRASTQKTIQVIAQVKNKFYLCTKCRKVFKFHFRLRFVKSEGDFFINDTYNDTIRNSKEKIKLPNKLKNNVLDRVKLWSHLGLNQGLPDYESGALTN